MNTSDRVRIDKWLWAVRVCRTRSDARDLCERGRVEVNGSSAKPSRMISAGDEVSVRKQSIEYRFRVLGCIEKRVGASKVPEYMADLTPEEAVEQARKIKAANRPVLRRPDGSGRPTKKDRRQLDELFGR